jgi:hypothetical protein
VRKSFNNNGCWAFREEEMTIDLIVSMLNSSIKFGVTTVTIGGHLGIGNSSRLADLVHQTCIITNGLS